MAHRVGEICIEIRHDDKNECVMVMTRLCLGLSWVFCLGLGIRLDSVSGSASGTLA